MIVVLGASGAIGSHVVDALVDAGRPVRTVSRGGAPARDGVEHRALDLRDGEQLRHALTGATAVVHAAQPPYTRWRREFPALTAGIADAAAGARLVFVDNLYAYGPVDGPLTEDLPLLARGGKGRVRAEMAQDLLSRHARGELEVVIARASDYFGPRGVGSTAGETLFGAIARGEPARLVGSADQPHSWSYLPDVGRAVALLADTPTASGGVWHLPVTPPVTPRELVAPADPAARVSVLPPLLHRLLAVGNPMLRELLETRYQLAAPFVVDDSRFRTLLPSFTGTALPDAVADTLAWFRDRSASASPPLSERR